MPAFYGRIACKDGVAAVLCGKQKCLRSTAELPVKMASRPYGAMTALDSM